MKTILITGASRGIGRATAEKFLTEGWQVIGTGTETVSDFTHENFHYLQLDFLLKDSIEEAVSKIDSPVDVLFNNAGVAYSEDTSAGQIDLLRKVMEVNLFGHVSFTGKLVSSNLIKAGGLILNTSSQMGAFSRPVPDDRGWISPAYRISKASLNMYTRVLAAEMEDKNITVGSLDPEWVKTDMGGASAPKQASEVADEVFELATRENLETGQFWRRGEKRDW